MIGDLLGSVYEIKLGANEWTELGFWDGRMFGTTLGVWKDYYLVNRIEYR